jgi:hypothetical protein
LAYEMVMRERKKFCRWPRSLWLHTLEMTRCKKIVLWH